MKLTVENAMTQQYSPEKQLIKDFIRYISDNHKCCVVSFPDEFAATQYVNYHFVNNGQLIEEFVNDIQRQDRKVG
jgi:1,2-phenylacetyl-CoA epoxidase catalytic subunit